MTQTKPSNRILAIILTIALLMTSIMLTQPQDVYGATIDVSGKIDNSIKNTDVYDTNAPENANKHYLLLIGSWTTWKKANNTYDRGKLDTWQSSTSAYGTKISNPLPAGAEVTKILPIGFNKGSLNFTMPKGDRYNSSELNKTEDLISKYWQDKADDQSRGNLANIKIDKARMVNGSIEVDYQVYLAPDRAVKLRTPLNDWYLASKAGNPYTNNREDYLRTIMGDEFDQRKPTKGEISNSNVEATFSDFSEGYPNIYYRAFIIDPLS